LRLGVALGRARQGFGIVHADMFQLIADLADPHHLAAETDAEAADLVRIDGFDHRRQFFEPPGDAAMDLADAVHLVW
jgi:hypothetical protein